MYTCIHTKSEEPFDLIFVFLTLCVSTVVCNVTCYWVGLSYCQHSISCSEHAGEGNI